MVGPPGTITKVPIHPHQTGHLARMTEGFPGVLVAATVERLNWKCYELKRRVHTKMRRTREKKQLKKTRNAAGQREKIRPGMWKSENKAET